MCSLNQAKLLETLIKQPEGDQKYIRQSAGNLINISLI